MRRSPLNSPSDPNRRRHTPYNWNSHENAKKRGYPSSDGVYQCFSANNGTPQISGNDFIPLDMSTPVAQYKKNRGNWRSPRGGLNNYSSPDSGGYYNRSNYNASRSKYNNTPNARCNYRHNYYTPSKSGSNNSYSPYKQPFRQFHKQRKGDKGAHRQMSISEYIDMPSCLEDPWEHLMKKLNISKDGDSTEKPENKLLRDVNVNNSYCSQESKIDSSLDTTFGEDSVNISQTSKADSLVDLEIGSICFDQNSLDESANSINDNIAEVMREKDNVHLDKSMADINEKNIQQ